MSLIYYVAGFLYALALIGTGIVFYRKGTDAGISTERAYWQDSHRRHASRFHSATDMRYAVVKLAEQRFKELAREMLNVPLERTDMLEGNSEQPSQCCGQ